MIDNHNPKRERGTGVARKSPASLPRSRFRLLLCRILTNRAISCRIDLSGCGRKAVGHTVRITPLPLPMEAPAHGRPGNHPTSVRTRRLIGGNCLGGRAQRRANHSCRRGERGRCQENPQLLSPDGVSPLRPNQLHGLGHCPGRTLETHRQSDRRRSKAPGWMDTSTRSRASSSRRTAATWSPDCLERGINWVDACCIQEVKAYSKALKGRREEMYMACSWEQIEVRRFRSTAPLAKRSRRPWIGD